MGMVKYKNLEGECPSADVVLQETSRFAMARTKRQDLKGSKRIENGNENLSIEI